MSKYLIILIFLNIIKDGIIAQIVSSDSPLTIGEGFNMFAESDERNQSAQIFFNRSKVLWLNITRTEEYVPLLGNRSNLAKHVALIKLNFENRSVCAYMAAIVAKNAVVSLNLPNVASIKLYAREYLCKKECDVDVNVLVGTSSCYDASSVHLQILPIKKIWLAEMTTTTLLILGRSITLSSAAAIIPLPKRLPREHESCVVLSTGKLFTYELFQLDAKIVMFSECDGSEFTKFGYTTVLCVKFLDIAGIDYQPNFCGLLSDSSPLICNGVLSGFYSGDESCTTEYAWFFNVYNTSSVIRTVLSITEGKQSSQCQLKPHQWFGLLLLYVDWMSYYNYFF